MAESTKNTKLTDFTTDNEESYQNESGVQEKSSTATSPCDATGQEGDQPGVACDDKNGHKETSSHRPTQKDDIKLVKNIIKIEENTKLGEESVDRYISAAKQYVRHLHLEGTSIMMADVSYVKSFYRKCAEVNFRYNTLTGKQSAIKKVYELIRTEKEQSAEMDLFELDEIDIRNFKTPPAIKREPLDDEEVEKLAQELDTREKLMVLIGLETGARNIDITKITINKVDLDDRKIELTDTKNNEIYTRPISETLAIQLRQWIKIGRSAISHSNQSDFLFPTELSDKISPTQFNYLVKSAAEDAGIQESLGEVRFTGNHKKIFKNIGNRTYHKVTPHALRHTLNVRLQKAGLDVEGRAAALNQDSLSVNKEHYSLPNTEYKSVLEELFDQEKIY